MTTAKEHWEKVYTTLQSHEVSWTQEVPKPSLDLIHHLHLSPAAQIIDVGGGDSRLVDFLLEKGYKNITVLDIAASALNKAKERLGDKAAGVNWVVQDITRYEPHTVFDCWHDRATFHFLTTQEQIDSYLHLLRNHVKKEGYVVLGTFSDKGPEKCSGLPVNRYSADTLTALLQETFENVQCITEDHITPFHTQQNFLFCCFKKKA